MQQFKDKYNAYPGDMSNAWAFFESKGCGGGIEARCNGNGNNYINITAGDAREDTVAWEHLNFAGLIDREFTFVYDDLQLDLNVPSTPKAGTAYWIWSSSIYIGEKRDSSQWYNGGAFSVLEGVALENKIDDGFPGKGRLAVLRDQDRFSTATICIDKQFDVADLADASFLYTDTGDDSCFLQAMFSTNKLYDG